MDDTELLKERLLGLWLNPERKPAAEALPKLPFTIADIKEADARLRRFAPLIEKLFPETAEARGVIESPLTETPNLKKAMGVKGRLFVKRDSELPIAGSVKARGGIYEVLLHTERILGEAVFSMSPEEIRERLAGYTVQVGSTGNLGLSIGIMSAALGYKAVVHMSSDAKQWKKDMLREKGVEVIEYEGDYSSAVAKGRGLSEADPMSYFVDDENSVPLFMGYAAAALRLKKQLDEAGINVDEAHPMNLYLPCGVGGAPGGITFGVKTVFGDAANCWFVEPEEAPCMLAAFLCGGPVPVTELGLTGKTEADGLAVGTASKLVYDTVRELVSGEITVCDAALAFHQTELYKTEGIFIEPSSASALEFAECFAEGLSDGRNITHIVWATGGRLVPDSERRKQIFTDVSAGLIWRGERFLIAKRPPHKARGGLWEFVGGKLESGETGEEALIRECREELGAEVRVFDKFTQVIHKYPDITVRLMVYNAEIESGEPKLLEHSELKWILPSEIPEYEFCPADSEVLERIIARGQFIRRNLFLNRDEKYADFQAKLIPGVPRESVIGLRLPDLRFFAKSFYGKYFAKQFMRELPHEYYDENMLHALMINEEKDYDTVIRLIDEFLPFVDNWAVCDTIKPKAFRKHRAELWKKIPEYIASERAFTVRFGIEMLMSHFLDADFKPEALDMVYDIESSEYYVQMMQAWYFATALAKQYRAAIPYLERGMKSETVRKMTVRKCMESFRIPDERKNYIKSLI